MSSRSCNDPLDGDLSLSDFRELIDQVLDAITRGDRTVKQVAFLPSPSPTFRNASVHSEQDYCGEIARLLRERRHINAYYGWVLASDTALVAKSLDGASSNETSRAKQSMRMVFKEYERVGEALAVAAQTLKTGQAQN